MLLLKLGMCIMRNAKIAESNHNPILDFNSIRNALLTLTLTPFCIPYTSAH